MNDHSRSLDQSPTRGRSRSRNRSLRRSRSRSRDHFFSKPESESESPKNGRLRSPALERSNQDLFFQASYMVLWLSVTQCNLHQLAWLSLWCSLQLAATRCARCFFMKFPYWAHRTTRSTTLPLLSQSNQQAIIQLAQTQIANNSKCQDPGADHVNENWASRLRDPQGRAEGPSCWPSG